MDLNSIEERFMQNLWVVFASVFIAELGDKTQLATLLFSTDKNMSPIGVFVASSLALVLSCLLAVAIGSQIKHFISPEKIKWGAGIGFIIIGAWMIWDSRA
jgi:putative Ca2+/H+ antiporter (TMEM165/GDT1 family)